MHEPASQPEPREPEPSAGAEREVRHLPVPVDRGPAIQAAPPRPIERAAVPALPATVAAAGGFVVGVATFVVTRLLRRRRAQRSLARALTRRGGRNRLDIAGSRSFLVDIHMLRR